ncbi:hypothetical protein BD324DRAFT_625753 [Kockovaella imperatae]|uniref:Smr domain-containing protein n=1 Tax=Kockovaella imperatae TaxID=4999 RepID=A0A1Y1UH12_9TREE|nr:hypothetical protein BD324DRAFT_625753 [Kockovaella imperatae]ORX37341.1 hypothetical protein BD324DRAFT_625753 [Kockovaella imperatae]
MTKKRRGAREGIKPSMGVDSRHHAGQTPDAEHLVDCLSVEYPLLDVALIHSLISDHEEPLTRLEEIRDQLGILEATLVPDLDGPRSSSVDHSSVGEGSTRDLEDGVRSLTVGSDAGDASSARGSGSGSTRYPSSKTQPTSLSMSISTSSSSLASDHPGLESATELSAQIDLLKTLFSDASTKTIRNAILAEPSLPAAIDHLLSLELIRQVEREGAWPDSEMSSGTEGDGFVHAAKSNQPASSRKKRAPRGITVPLVDSLQRRPAPINRSSSRTIIPAGPSSNAWGTVSSLSAYLSDLLSAPSSYFLSYFHSPNYHSALSAIRAALNALPANTQSGDPKPVLEDLYGVQLSEEPGTADDLAMCARVTDDVSIIMDLMDLLAEVSYWPGDNDVLASALNSTGASRPSTAPPTPRLASTPMTPSSSQDSVTSHKSRAGPHPGRLLTRPISQKPTAEAPEVKVIPGSQAPPSAAFHQMAMDNFGQPSSYARHTSKSSKGKSNGSVRQVHPLNWRTVDHARHHPARTLHPLASNIPSYARGATPHDPSPGSLYRHPRSSEVDLYYVNANKEREKRADAIRAAANHFSGSALSGGKSVNVMVAGHYASQAREAEQRARDWEMKAAQRIVSDQLALTGNGIDLHHLTVEEGTLVALEMTRKWYDAQKAANYAGTTDESRRRIANFTPSSGLVVVTGKGRHSKGQRGVLGPSVASALRRDGWRVEEGMDRGYLVVKGRA